MRRKKTKGTRRVAYELIAPDSTNGRPMYALLHELVDAHHEHLVGARIALAWCTSWRPDVDGRVTLGKCKKASDLDRELAAFDFIILLRKAFWQDLLVSADKRRALLHHELCHAAVTCDARTGDPVYDERGRKTYRLRKHDIEEFGEVVRLYGCYKADLERFAADLLARRANEVFTPCDRCLDSPGYVATDDRRVARCACWLAWQERREALAS